MLRKVNVTGNMFL